MSLRKMDIAKNVSSKAQISSSISSNIVSFFFKTIKTKSNYNIVKISNFGSFEKRVTPERVGRNPKTKKEFLILKRSKLFFKASSLVKRILNWFFLFKWSGWPDLNRRPLHPQCSALPDCATSRIGSIILLIYD